MTEPSPLQTHPFDLSQARLLIVDDSKMMRMAIARSLQELGVVFIQEAANGQQALALIKSEPFDLMLLDIEMPEMDGMQVLAEIQKDQTLQGLPVIVISGGQDIQSAVRCIEMGAEDYLNKPFSQVLLRARLNTSIEKKKLRDLNLMRMHQLQSQHAQLISEQQKTETVLLNILPRSISDRIKSGETRIADTHPSVSVLFADLVGFTQLSHHMGASELVQILNEIVSEFDNLVHHAGIEKIKTIGDCYMLVAGAPIYRADHPFIITQIGLAMIEALKVFNKKHNTQLQIRVGINSGPVVAGVIGIHKYTYDLWGDTVNIASRMESTGLPNQLQISANTASLIADNFDLEARGEIDIKGIGKLPTFLVSGLKQPSSAQCYA
jgi:adenylate cyclase